MSFSTAPLADGTDSPTASSYAHGGGGDDGASYPRNGSLNAKLFAKNPPHVSVDDRVDGHHYEEQEDAGESSVSDDESECDDEHANGNGHAALDDEDDDEYIPGSSDEDSGGESDADVEDDGDLDDEETSMRSLLLPMAKYAKQLLFLGEDDDSDFDEQDAELWDSPHEKREWIQRYETMNRAYIDQYGCRIDAPANPDIKKRLRRERNREAKYSLVLLALAVAYLVRLLMGPLVMQPLNTASSIAPPSPTEPTSESAPSPALSDATQGWEIASPPWWTVWTEKLVVRALEWPRSIIISLQSTQDTALPVDSGSSGQPASPSSDLEKISANEASSPLPTTTERPGDDSTQTPPPQPLGSVNVIIEEDVAVPTKAPDEIAIGSSMPAGNPITEADQKHTSTVDSLPLAGNIGVTVSTERTSLSMKVQEPLAPEADAVATDPEMSVGAEEQDASMRPWDKVNVDERTHNEGEDVRREKTAAKSLKRCLDMFYMLVKMKHDASVKNAAMNECDQAVNDAFNPASIYWIQARVLRGDMRSLIQSFRDAQGDYEAALTSDAVSEATFRSEIQIKIASNRWIEYYHTKQFKDLRSDCQRVVNNAATTAPAEESDRVVELARDWLRAFRKETKVLEVLTKTRAWTLYRPTVPETSKD
jgi:hypothetical protein